MKYECKKCGKSFGNKRSLEEHIKEKHRPTYVLRKVSVIVIVAMVVGLGGLFLATRETPIANLPPPISGVECWMTGHEEAAYHVHTLLEIYVRGSKVRVPANVGIVEGVCMYALHTHDESGLIHVEAPSYKSYTLGQFFDVWGKALSRSRFLDLDLTSQGLEMRVYVDGRLYEGDPRNIELLDKRVITIDVGPPFAKGS